MSQTQGDFYEDNIVYRELKPFFGLGKAVFDFCNESTDDVGDWKLDESLESNLRDVVSHLFYSSLKTFCSILFLCNKGHGEDAMALTRTIFDNYVTLKYIQKNPGENIYKFMNYLVLENKFRLDQAKEPSSKMSPEVKKLYIGCETKIVQNYDKIKEFYVKPGEAEDKSLRKFKSGRWAGVDKKQMAKDVGLEFDYDYVFHFHSCFVHPHPYGLRSFCEESNSELHFGAKPSAEGVFPSLPVAIRYFLLIFKEWTASFQLGKSTEIETFLNEVTKLENEHISKMESCNE